MPIQRNSGYQFDPLSEKIDLAWAGKPADEKKFNNYYDYFFSGEDVKIYIDGLFDEKDELDIASFAYVIRQEKQPVYGFWSYNYDAIAYGTRLISGEFSVYTRYPRRMTELLERATEARVSRKVGRNPNDLKSSLRNMDLSKSIKDEQNINKFWSYSQLDRVSNDPFTKNIIDSSKNIFSAHPPFNFIVLLGAEEVSLSPKDLMSSDNATIDGNMDRMLMFDVNERLVKPGSESKVSPMKIVLQEVQLLGMSTGYSVGGSPLVENYQFIARDFYFSEVELGFIKNQISTNSSEEPTTQSTNVDGVKEQTSTNTSS